MAAKAELGRIHALRELYEPKTDPNIHRPDSPDPDTSDDER